MNYIIEDNIDFYKEIYADIESDDESMYCLITNDKLEEDYVTLECNHKFNYDAIYNDVYNHKNKFNVMERKRLHQSQLRCPYCRNIQNKLLPFNSKYPNVQGVNYYNVNIENNKPQNLPKNKYVAGCCEYDYSNELSSYNLHENKYTVCDILYVKYLPQDKKYYCCFHGSIIRKKLKTMKNINLDENVIITVNSCNAILKTGCNKGELCGINKIYKDGLCKRHYNVTKKK